MVRDDAENGRDRIDLLAEEFADRLRRGESPSLTEFAARETGDEGEVRALLASVAMIEQFKRQKFQARGDAAPPDQLGDFRIVRELGRGGMGIVYEAEQASLGRRVAVKVLPAHALLDPTRRRRFQNEAQTAAGLHHTNIVPIFGVGESDSSPATPRTPNSVTNWPPYTREPIHPPPGPRRHPPGPGRPPHRRQPPVPGAGPAPRVPGRPRRRGLRHSERPARGAGARPPLRGPERPPGRRRRAGPRRRRPPRRP